MPAGSETAAQVLRHLGVIAATFDRCRKQYGGMKSEEARRLKELEIEDARLRRLVAEKEFDIGSSGRRTTTWKHLKSLAAEDGREPRPGAAGQFAASDLFGAGPASFASLVFGSGT